MSDAPKTSVDGKKGTKNVKKIEEGGNGESDEEGIKMLRVWSKAMPKRSDISALYLILNWESVDFFYNWLWNNQLCLLI